MSNGKTFILLDIHQNNAYERGIFVNICGGCPNSDDPLRLAKLIGDCNTPARIAGLRRGCHLKKVTLLKYSFPWKVNKLVQSFTIIGL